jgi:hypothetical protein
VQAPDEQGRHADHEGRLRDEEQEPSVHVVHDGRAAERPERQEAELHEPQIPECGRAAEIVRLDEDGESHGAHRQTGRQHGGGEETEVA